MICRWFKAALIRAAATLTFVTCCALFGLTGTAQATLIKTDLLQPGDNLLTLDEATGLEWLNLYDNSISVPDGPDSDLTPTIPEWTASRLGASLLGNLGFRFATESDIRTLFTDAGIVELGVFGQENGPGALLLLQQLGALFGGATPIQFGFFETAADSSVFGSTNIEYTGDSGIAQINCCSGTIPRPDSLDVGGPYLVRSVAVRIPEPSSLILFGLGLLILGAMRRPNSAASRATFLQKR